MTDILEQVEVQVSNKDGEPDHLYCIHCVTAGYCDAVCGVESNPDRPSTGDKCPDCVRWLLNVVWPYYCKRGHYSTGLLR